jgi:hypothetical protein
MQKRPWDAKATALIVLEGLTGKPVAELCTAHQLSPSPYDHWRDQCLAHAGRPLTCTNIPRERSAWRRRTPG